MNVYGRPVRLICPRDVSAAGITRGLAMLRQMLDVGIATTRSEVFFDDAVDGEVRVIARVVGGDRTLYLNVEKITCDDERGFLLLAENSQKMHASYCDGFVEQIDPLDGKPRPDPDPAERTKFQRIPKKTRPPIEFHAGQFSGQMKAVVQCLIIRGQDKPIMSPKWTKTHGIVEVPFVRKDPKKHGKTYLVEIGVNGVYAMPFKYTGRCCDLDDRLTEQDEVALHLLFGTDGHDDIRRLRTQAEMSTIYSKGSPPYSKCGWAFSYTGHEAANVVFEPHNSPENFWLISLVKIKFGVDQNGDLTAETEITENDRFFRGSASALFWFPSDSQPGQYEQLFPFEFNGGADVPWGGIPLYCFYSGSELRVLRTDKSISQGTTDTDNWQGECPELLLTSNWPVNSQTLTNQHSYPQGGGYIHSIGADNVFVSFTRRRFESIVYTEGGATQWKPGSLITGSFCGGLGHFSNWFGVSLISQETLDDNQIDTGRIGAIALQSDREAVCLVSSTTTTSNMVSSFNTATLGQQGFQGRNYLVSEFPTQADVTDFLGDGWHAQPLGGVPCGDSPALTGCANGTPLVDDTFPGCCQGPFSSNITRVYDTTRCVFVIRDRAFEVAAEKYSAVPFTIPINPAVAPPFRNPGPDGLCSGLWFLEENAKLKPIEDRGRKYVLKGGPPVVVPSTLKSALQTGPMTTAAAVCFAGRI